MDLAAYLPPSGPPRPGAQAPSDGTPQLQADQRLALEEARYPGERALLAALLTVSLGFVAFFLTAIIAIGGFPLLVTVATGIAALWLFSHVAFVLLYWFVYGNSVLVSAHQYPSLHHAIERACTYLELPNTPSVFVFHGSGLLEVFVAKRFTKRGMLLFTAEAVDTLLGNGDSRQLMMIIGRQLGHIRAGHFRFWVLTDLIGVFALPLYAAWRRATHFTADRIGYLVCGDLESAQRALIAITVGKTLAPQTALDGLREQYQEACTRFMSRVREWFLPYPYIVRRIIALESFRNAVRAAPVNAAGRAAVGTFPPEANTFTVYVYGNGPVQIGDSNRMHAMAGTA